MGPFEDGSFRAVKVSSIRRNKAACRLVRAQQSAALALDIPVCQLRRGMVATSPQGEQPVACQYFQVLTGVVIAADSIFVKITYY